MIKFVFELRNKVLYCNMFIGRNYKINYKLCNIFKWWVILIIWGNYGVYIVVVFFLGSN